MLKISATQYGFVLCLGISLVAAQYVSDSDDIVDDLSFLDVAEDRGENARLCVCFRFPMPIFDIRRTN